MRNRPVQGVGHTALTYDPGVYLVVRRELRDAADLWRQRHTASAVPEGQAAVTAG